MIIVSQDKTEIINFNTIDFIDIIPMDDGRFEIDANFEHCITELGYYETEERAKGILQEIIERYTNWNNLVCGQPTGECSPKYEMPKE